MIEVKLSEEQSKSGAAPEDIAELASAIREEHGYGPRVTGAVERFHHAMGQLQTETIRHVFAMREVLTPEQKQVFDNTVVSALTTEQQ